MSKRFWGERWYKVTVREDEQERTVTIGQYANAPNAVFGALRKCKVDYGQMAQNVHVHCELMPPKPGRMAKAAYTRHLRAIHDAT